MQTSEEMYKDFGNKLKELRLSKNLTQLEVAERLNLSRTAVNQYELGNRKVPLAMLITFASFYGITVDELLETEKMLKETKEEKETTETIVKNIKELRKQKHISLIELANELDISESIMKEYEEGTRKIPLSMLIHISKYFNASIDELFGVNFFKGNETAFVSTNERQVELHKQWNEVVGEINFTDKEHELIMETGLFVKNIRGKENYDQLLDMASLMIKQLNK